MDTTSAEENTNNHNNDNDNATVLSIDDDDRSEVQTVITEKSHNALIHQPLVQLGKIELLLVVLGYVRYLLALC